MLNVSSQYLGTHRTSLTPPLFIKVPVPSHAIEFVIMCVLVDSFYDLVLDFETVPIVWYYFICHCIVSFNTSI